MKKRRKVKEVKGKRCESLEKRLKLEKENKIGMKGRKIRGEKREKKRKVK